MPNRNTHHITDEEESYFVSMTDLMVGMLFVFIILLMSFALNYRVAETVKNTTVKNLTSAQKARAEMLRDIRNYLKSHGIQVRIDEQNGILRLPEEILFAKAKAHLSEQGEIKIKHVADALSKVLPCYAREQIGHISNGCSKFPGVRLEAVFIEGHTDSDKFVKEARRDNWLLSAERSINTYKAIIAQNYNLEKILNSRSEQVLSVSSYGPNRPTSRKESQTVEDYKKANRRIDLRFLMETPRPEVVPEIERRIQEGIKLGKAAINMSPEPVTPQINDNAAFVRGEVAFNDREYDEALKWFRKAAGQGNTKSQAWVGMMYARGVGIEQNYDEAVKWFRKAAKRGSKYGEFSLGIMYNNGFGVEQNYKLAMEWFRKAADRGHVLAQQNLEALRESRGSSSLYVVPEWN
jgi:chemotaxis protein MotB